MKLLLLTIVFLSVYVGVAQTNKKSNTPVQLLYGERTAEENRRGPVISGVLNALVINELTPVYPEKAQALKIKGRVEVQLLINEDGEVIFANPLSGPEELWAESVRTSVMARFRPFTLEGQPAKRTGRLILDFKNGHATVAKRVEF